MDTKTQPLNELAGGELMEEIKRLWHLRQTTIQCPDLFPEKELARLLEAEGLLVKSHNTALAADATISRLLRENEALRGTFQQLTGQIESLEQELVNASSDYDKLEAELTVAEETTDSLRDQMENKEARITQLEAELITAEQTAEELRSRLVMGEARIEMLSLGE